MNAKRNPDQPRSNEDMSELQGIARLKILDGKLEEFKRLSSQCMEAVRTKDTGTVRVFSPFQSL